MYDYFAADLRCPGCGTVSSATAYTNMQTHLRDDANGSVLAVGYELEAADLTTSSIVASGYSLITSPSVGGEICLLEVWTCQACVVERWASVRIVNQRIARIEAVSMNRATFELRISSPRSMLSSWRSRSWGSRGASSRSVTSIASKC